MTTVGWGSWLLMRLGSGYSLGAGGQRVDRGAACACRVECLWLLWLLGTLGLPARWIFILTIVIKVDCPWLLWLLSTLVLPADCNHFHPHYCQLWWSKLTASGSFDCWAQLCCPLTATILILTIFIKVDCLWLLWLLRTLTIRVCCPLPTVTNLIFTAIIILLILVKVDCCSSDGWAMCILAICSIQITERLGKGCTVQQCTSFGGPPLKSMLSLEIILNFMTHLITNLTKPWSMYCNHSGLCNAIDQHWSLT